MGVFDGKGMSINVNLSVEQMEAIASLTADKVNLTRKYDDNKIDWMQRDLEVLRKQVQERDGIITQNVLSQDRYRELLKKRNQTIKQLREEIEELKAFIIWLIRNKIWRRKIMKLVCECGNVAEFNTIDEDTGEQTSYTEGEGQYVTVDISKFNFWQKHDVVGIVCENCEKDIWLFT